MRLPLGDWQFWVVTAIAAGVVIFAVWSLLRGARRRKSTRVTLTVDREETGG